MKKLISIILGLSVIALLMGCAALQQAVKPPTKNPVTKNVATTDQNKLKADSIALLKKQVAEQDKLLADLRSKDDLRIEQGNQFENLQKENENLKTTLNQSNTFRDSISSRLLALENESIKNNTYKKTKTDTLVKKAPVDTTKKDSKKSVGKNKVVAKTYVTGIMGPTDTAFVSPKGPKIVVDLPTNGQMAEADSGRVRIVKESNVEKLQPDIKKAKSEGKTIYRARK